MSYEVAVSRAGGSAIAEQVEWYRADEQHGGEELAAKWLAKLEPALASLAVMPRKHGLAPENGRWHPEIEVRQLLFRPWKSGAGWRVLFAIDDSVRVVTVLQVRHGRRRWLFESGAGDAA